MKIISVFIIISLLTMGKQSKVSKETREKKRKSTLRCITEKGIHPH